MKLDCEVVVVGAGPAGSTAARALAERGHEVVLVDRASGARSEIVCTGIVGREAFDALSLPEEPVRTAIRRARFISPSGVDVEYAPRRPMAYVVDRTRFDAALALRATEAGARLLRGHEARGLERGRGGVTVRLRGEARDGVRARAVVIATGHQRHLHGAAGLGHPPAYVHGVHADLPFEDLEEAELYFGEDVAPGFFAWAVPFGDGLARLGVLAPQGGRRYFRRFLRRPAISDRLGVDPEDGGARAVRRRLRSRGIVQGAVRPSYADRVLAVGEAAGQVKTTTAGGIYYGMLGAGLAAERLHRGLATGRLDSGFLSGYEEAWRGRLGEELALGFELQRAGREMTDEEIDELFGALRSGIAAAIRKVVEFDWHRAALQILFRRHRGLRGRLRDRASRTLRSLAGAG